MGVVNSIFQLGKVRLQVVLWTDIDKIPPVLALVGAPVTPSDIDVLTSYQIDIRVCPKFLLLALAAEFNFSVVPIMQPETDNADCNLD